MTHRFQFFALCLITCCSLAWPVSAQENTLDQLLFESSEMLRLGKPAQALSLLNAKRSTYTESPEFLNNLAIAYLGNNEPEHALAILQELVENDPLFSIIGHNLLEMELGAAGLAKDQINPILFVQSVNSFSSGVEIPDQTELPAPDLADTLLEGALRSSLQSWANAWSAKDFNRYINHYATAFEPENGMSLEVWRQSREIRLGKPGNIQVTIQNLEVFPGSVSPKVQFDQIYESTTFSDRTRKEMTFAQDGDRWKISAEKTIRTY